MLTVSGVTGVPLLGVVVVWVPGTGFGGLYTVTLRSLIACLGRRRNARRGMAGDASDGSAGERHTYILRGYGVLRGMSG